MKIVKLNKENLFPLLEAISSEAVAPDSVVTHETGQSPQEIE